MALERIERVVGRVVQVAGDDIDTDRIIPARFMRCVTFDGLGEHLFHDVRFGPDGRRLGHPLDRPEHRGATILLTGNNFGCGSSREHAPQALRKHGIRAVIAGGFAEIFFGNATTLGIPCVTLGRGEREALAAAVERDPALGVTVDLRERVVRFGGQVAPFQMLKDGARISLMEGQWDPIGLLLEASAEVRRLAGALPY